MTETSVDHRRSSSTGNHPRRPIAKKKKRKDVTLPNIYGQSSLEASFQKGAVHDRKTWLSILDKLQNSQNFVESVLRHSPRNVSPRQFHKTVPGLFVPSQKHMVLGLTVKKNRLKTPKEKDLGRIPNLLSNEPANPPNNPDWATSELYAHTQSGHFKFNWQNDHSVFSNAAQVKKYLGQTSNFSKPPAIIQKGVNTIEKLKKELMLGKHLNYKFSAKSVYLVCQQLFDVRKVTLDILANIHDRENIALEIQQTHNQEEMQFLYNRFQLVSSKILSIISNWKDLNIPFDRFIFNGVDFSQKIEEDFTQMLAKVGGDPQ